MPARTSTGECYLCHQSFSKAAMSRHLAACVQKQAAAEAGGAQPSTKARYFHILVEGRDQPDYWLHLDVRAAAKLRDLDAFLRDIWLECCGHLSAFTIDATRYSVEPIDDLYGEDERSMNVKLERVLRARMTFSHEYDFGTTTELRLKVVAERIGPVRREYICLLARNHPPKIPCELCSKPATKVCPVCVWSGEAWYCDECAPKHECEDDYFLPVVNSPRTGMCGYSGPGE